MNVQLPARIGESVKIRQKRGERDLDGVITKYFYNNLRGMMVVIHYRKPNGYYTSGNFSVKSFGETIFLAN